MILSVLMPVHRKDDPIHVDIALGSMFRQSFTDYELVLVADGPLTDELDRILEKWNGTFGERLILKRLPQSLGVAGALNIGLRACQTDLIVRMDSDDYSEPNRLSVQFDYLQTHPDIDVLGSNVAEFEGDLDHLLPHDRNVPLTHDEIVGQMWLKNPINHPTVVYRKNRILAVGGYKPHRGDDDYLWAELWESECRFANIPDRLVRYRISSNSFVRRGGLKYFLWDFHHRWYLYTHHRLGLGRFIAIMAIAAVYRFSPTRLRRALHDRFL